ncbi:hypothetical protein Prudu_010085, partial [Prunus dulcis]
VKKLGIYGKFPGQAVALVSGVVAAHGPASLVNCVWSRVLWYFHKVGFNANVLWKNSPPGTQIIQVLFLVYYTVPMAVHPSVLVERECTSTDVYSNSLISVSVSPASAVTEALKSWRRVKPPVWTEKRALDRSKPGSYETG